MVMQGMVKANDNVKSENWWARQDLNLGPTDYESAALTAELQARKDLATDRCPIVAQNSLQSSASRPLPLTGQR